MGVQPIQHRASAPADTRNARAYAVLRIPRRGGQPRRTYHMACVNQIPHNGGIAHGDDVRKKRYAELVVS